MKLPHVKKPCKDCPFRKDSLKGWLGEDRMTEIIYSDSFVCHKETTLQCAGHMIINGPNNQFNRLAHAFGYKLDLKGQELIFDDIYDCIKHHRHPVSS